MRYCLTLIASLVSATAVAATAIDGADYEPEFTTCLNLSCGEYVSTKFRMGENLLSGKRVVGETFFTAEATSSNYKTAFRPEKILSVYNHSSGQIYVPGKDYIATPEGIELTEGSAIVRAPKGYADSATPDELKNYGVKVTTDFQTYQYSIDYLKSDTFKPKTAGNLNAFVAKLGKSPVSITFFGDSITVGANATSIYAPPNQPGYAGLISARLNELYPTMISTRNNSVGGWSTPNAVSSVEYRVNDKTSDLVVLAFGMNDAGSIPPDQYRANIKTVIEAIRAKSPETSILLLSSTRANPKTFTQKPEYLDSYYPQLVALSKDYKNIAVVDLTSLWDRLLQNKSYYDITGNGMNHPNDFAHKAVADAILPMLTGRD